MVDPATAVADAAAPKSDLQVAATTFTLFNQAPVELRLRIWRCALPAPRTFRLDRMRDKAEFPVTLWVNHESRAETEKYYWVALDPSCRLAGLDWAVCFAPTRDEALFSAHDIIRYGGAIFNGTLNNINMSVPGGLGAIRQLEVTDIGDIISAMGMFRVMHDLKAVFWGFSGLEEVTFTGNTKRNGRASSEGMEIFKTDMTQFFAQSKARFSKVYSIKFVFAEP